MNPAETEDVLGTGLAIPNVDLNFLSRLDCFKAGGGRLDSIFEAGVRSDESPEVAVFVCAIRLVCDLFVAFKELRTEVLAVNRMSPF